jgi:RNA polymerase sigma-70 factor (ECF subfamily)
VRAWLAVVGVRLAIDERRRRRRWGFLPIRETDQEWAMTTDPDLWRAMGELDRRTRAALILTVLDGYSQEEVAELLDAPRGTVAAWLSRGKARLRATLSESR